MQLARIGSILLLVLSAPTLAPTGSLADSRPRPRPERTNPVDPTQRIDVNTISMVVKNTGSFAYDTQNGAAGLEFPKGSGHTVVFAAGLWLAAVVNGSVRVSVAEYTDDFKPGAAPGGVPENSANPALKVYKLNRLYSNGTGGIDSAARDAALADYLAGAVPRGAPPVIVLADGSLSITGDQMLWSVYNDFLKGPAHNGASSRLPLGVEVQQTAWAYDHSVPLDNVVFMKFRIINRGLLMLSDMYAAAWSDPDLGGFADDLVGCVSTQGLGYCYNATNADDQYGSTPPALGFDMLQGPFSLALGTRLAPSAFIGEVNGDGPADSLETFHQLEGLDKNGAPILDPLSNPTKYMFTGDPVTGVGWLDSSPSDRRMVLSAGPFTMGPTHVQEIVLAIIVARGADRLSSIVQLRDLDELVQTAFDTGTLDILRVPGAHASPLSFAPPWPNPARGPISLAMSLAAEGEVSLAVVDITGRRVLQRSLGQLAPGPHIVALDPLRDRLAAGLYFVQLTQGGATVSRRFALLH